MFYMEAVFVISSFLAVYLDSFAMCLNVIFADLMQVNVFLVRVMKYHRVREPFVHFCVCDSTLKLGFALLYPSSSKNLAEEKKQITQPVAMS